MIGRLLGLFFAPIKNNAAFFIFMYALGLVCTYAVVPDRPNAHAYLYAWEELFVDVYLLCVLLQAFRLLRFGGRSSRAGQRITYASISSHSPSRASARGQVSRWCPDQWAKRLFYVVAYAVALADVYCFVKFDSTLTPTMLLLVGETNRREAGEFLGSMLSLDTVFSPWGWVLLLLLVHVLWSVLRKVLLAKGLRVAAMPQPARPLGNLLQGLAGVATLALLVYCAVACWPNKEAFGRLMAYGRIGDVEHELTRPDKAELYQPLYRLAFSVRANRVASSQLDVLSVEVAKVEVDSCSFKSPDIVLIIGESYNRHHAQLYSYDKPTTPRQQARAQAGELWPFADVVAPWNLTSFVFKHLFSLYVVGDKGEWCDYPLFPEVFRKAGYHVTFLTNQFLPQAKEAVYDFSGGFFLNNPKLSAAMFDTRNERLTYFDEGLLKAYDQLKAEEKANNLTIFHLKGQHLDYRTRCPKSKQRWTAADYDRPKLSEKEKRTLAYYDNAVLYNDSIVDQIIRRFEQREAIVVYVPDHGEQVYDDDVHFICRNHNAAINPHMAHYEYEIPFWIYLSPSYRERHPDVVWQVEQAVSKRFMTDALPHMLLYLGGIQTKDYRKELNLLSIHYNEQRPRILKNTTDYDRVVSGNQASSTLNQE